MNFVVPFLPAVDLLLQTDVLLSSLLSFESQKLCDLGTSSRVPMEARFPAHDKLFVELFFNRPSSQQFQRKFVGTSSPGFCWVTRKIFSCLMSLARDVQREPNPRLTMTKFNHSE